MRRRRFEASGPYVAFGIRGGCIGGFDTLAEAKRACASEGMAPCGRWTNADDSAGRAYYANNGCSVLVGYDHPHVKLTREEIDKATDLFRWRESHRWG